MQSREQRNFSLQEVSGHNMSSQVDPMNVYLLANQKERVKKAFYVKSHKCQSKGLLNHCFSVSTFLAYFLHDVVSRVFNSVVGLVKQKP